MTYLLGEAGLAERVLAILLEDDDGLAWRHCWLRQDDSGPARRRRAEIIHAQAIGRSALTGRQPGRAGVQA
jgi:hypothetical protein